MSPAGPALIKSAESMREAGKEEGVWVEEGGERKGRENIDISKEIKLTNRWE